MKTMTDLSGDGILDELLDAYRSGKEPLAELISETSAAVDSLPHMPYREQDDEYRRTMQTDLDLHTLDRRLRGIVQDEQNAARAGQDADNPYVVEAARRAAQGAVQCDKGVTVFGYLAVTEEFTARDAGYECAAWYQEHIVQPGVYELRGRFTEYDGGTYYITCTYDTVLAGSDFTSKYGGVSIGEPALDEHRGERGQYTVQQYGYTFPSVYAPGMPWGRLARVFLTPEFAVHVDRGVSQSSGVPRISHVLRRVEA